MDQTTTAQDTDVIDVRDVVDLTTVANPRRVRL